MKRKVNLVGQNTLTISLPTRWVVERGIKKGDDLLIEEKGDRIIVLTNKTPSIGTWIINAKDLDLKLIKRYIIAGYKLGAEKIRFTNTSSEIINSISPLIQRNILGFDIIDQSLDSFTIQNLQSDTNTGFEQTLRMIYRLLIQMGEECEKVIRTKDLTKIEGILQLEGNNNRLTNLLRRQLNIGGHIAREKVMYAYLLVEYLEKTADLYAELAMILKESKSTLVEKVTCEYLHSINIQLERFYSMYYNTYSNKSIAIFVNEKEKLSSTGDKLLNSSKGTNTILLSILIQINKKIFEMLAPYFSLSIPLEKIENN